MDINIVSQNIFYATHAIEWSSFCDVRCFWSRKTSVFADDALCGFVIENKKKTCPFWIPDCVCLLDFWWTKRNFQNTWCVVWWFFFPDPQRTIYYSENNKQIDLNSTWTDFHSQKSQFCSRYRSMNTNDLLNFHLRY